MKTAPVRQPEAAERLAAAEQQAGIGKAPRPDCAIWNDIARALGTNTGQSK